MFKQVIFGIVLSCASVSCYQVVQVSTSPTIGVSVTTFWDCSSKSLYYTDFFTSGATPMLFRYDYVTNRHYSASILGASVGVTNLIPLNCAPNQFLVTFGPCAGVIYWDGISSTAIKLRDIFCVDQGLSNHIISYAKVDLKRRLYTGTVHSSYCSKMPPEASLYRYDKLQGPIKIFGGIGASAGMDWNIWTKQFYHIDVCQNSIMEYQWSPLTGALTYGRLIYKFTDQSIAVNGMTIDKFGMLYVTQYNGSSVVKIDPRTSSVVETYILPARFPSSITFCGPALDSLCVSTGSIAVDVRTGTVAGTPITPSDGKLYIITDIFTRGHCDRKVCT